MKITLVIASLGAGGAERVAVVLAEGFLKRGHKVTVVTIYNSQEDFYKLSDGICRVALNIAMNSSTLLSRIWHNVSCLLPLRRAIQSIQPDAVISFLDQTNVITSLALSLTQYPLIATEHCDPSMISYGAIWEKLRYLTYPNIDRLVSVSEGVARHFNWLPKAKRTVINNPLTPDVFLPSREEQVSNGLLVGEFSSKEKTRSLVAMGRLTEQKGFDLLLQAFASLKDIYPEWELTILGEGELRVELESLRENLRLSSQVHFPGLIQNPFEIIRQADIFVLSSRFEGFGNVLIEAMACGLPVISADCPSGPQEIIRDGVDGILVPTEDVEALAKAMARLMSSEEERKRLSARATDVVERFSLEKIIGMWEELLAQVIEEKL